MRCPLPQLVLAYYGDDFTGSTDVMEAFTINGLPTVLFLAPPSPDDLAAFPAARAVGVAGVARAQPPEWMDEHLPPMFAALARLGAPIVQYKICSTFDSSPRVGSIGRALDLGRRVLAPRAFTPIVVGAPALKRYVLFGNLFATVGQTTHRLDRHPTMANHPVTPMTESDLGRHLSAQSNARLARYDVLALARDDYEVAFDALLADRPDAVIFDTLDARSLERAGALIWKQVAAPAYCVASSGLNYALAAHWRAAGLLPAPAARAPLPAADRIAIVSASCSPATGGQIARAEHEGFAAIRIDPRQLVDEARAGAECARARAVALGGLRAGRSVVIFTARGPADEAVAAFNDFIAEHRIAREQANERVAGALGALLRELLLASGVRRAMVCGGDTSGPAARALGLHALTMRAPLAPGSPLCTAHARDARLDGLEVALKGGQVGGPEYFLAALRGQG